MKILILRFSSLGDIVLISPVIRALKTQLENGEIHVATKETYEEVFRENPYVDQLHLLKKGQLNVLINTFKREKIDLIIDLHHNVRTWWIKRRLGVKSRSFSKLNFEKWLLVNFKIDLMPPLHIVDRYMETVSHLGVKPDSLGLDFFISEKDEVPLEWLPVPFRKGFVAVVIGGQYYTKRLPVNRLIELCDRINKPVVLIGGKSESAIGETIEAFFHRKSEHSDREETLQVGLGKKTEVFNGCGKFNVSQSASLIRQSLVVFSHDTGMMHIAAAFGKTIYTIWGNTVPKFGMYPYRVKFTIFENNKIGCRPCTKIGKNSCPKGHFKCMNDVVFDFYLP